MRLTQGHEETVADFKQRIALVMRERETGKKYSVVGASRPPEWCRKQKHVEIPKGGVPEDVRLIMQSWINRSEKKQRRIRPRGQIKAGRGEFGKRNIFCD
jgi:hypothetical protein